MEILNISMQEYTRTFNKYRSQILTGIIAVALAISGLIYWQFNRVKQEENALQALSEVLTEYNKAYDNKELWQDVEVGARTGFMQFSGSSLGPYFLMLQADALVQQEKFNDALVLMKTMMNKLSSHSPFYYIYKIKFARMKLASEDNAVQKEGLDELTTLAENEKNPEKEQAEYFLGLYYHHNDQHDKAEKLWKSLIAQQQHDSRSVWAMMAEQQLA